MKKYKLLEDDTMVINGKNLYRIKSLKNFGNIKKNELGGYIEKECNLSHFGECWVHSGSRVYDDALVEKDAMVFKGAEVFDSALCTDKSYVGGDSRVYGNATLCDSCIILGEVEIYGNSRIADYARLFDNVRVMDSAYIGGATKLRKDFIVFKDAYITSDSDYVCIDPVGSKHARISAFKTRSERIYLKCDNFLGSLKEFEMIVKTFNEIEYDYVIKLIKKMLQ